MGILLNVCFLTIVTDENSNFELPWSWCAMETPMAQRIIIVSQSMKNEDAHFYKVDVFLYGCATICVEAYPICRLFYCCCVVNVAEGRLFCSRNGWVFCSKQMPLLGERQDKNINWTSKHLSASLQNICYNFCAIRKVLEAKMEENIKSTPDA